MSLARRFRRRARFLLLLAPGTARAPRLLASLLVVAAFSGCTRASASALLPSLQLTLVAHRLARFAAGTESSASERWDAALLVSAQFRARTVAAELPMGGELSPEAWIAPCDADDVICLQEAADAEQELRAALGELQ